MLIDDRAGAGADLDCAHCNGTLQWRDANANGPRDTMGPCTHCLTCPATDEIREVARDWLGPRPFEGGWPRWSAWWATPQRVVPAYLGAGRALLMEVLARRWDCHPMMLGASMQAWAIAPHTKPHVWRGTDVSSIPEDVPPELRLARALVLAVGSS